MKASVKICQCGAATFMEAEKNDLASAMAIISFDLGFHKMKLGNEGLMMHYDIAQQIGEAFCEKYPADFDWEDYYIKGGEDRDVVCEEFAKEYIKEKDVFVDRSYYEEPVQYYKVVEAKQALKDQLSPDDELGTIIQAFAYTRGEAIKKAKAFDGRIEKIPPEELNKYLR